MTCKIPFLDLRITDNSERQELLTAIDTVFQHGRFIVGPEVAQFENEMAALCNRKFAVGVDSGTSALFLALKAIGAGPGDEVITTSLSWIATANAIALTGAKPVFADINDDLNIDPESVAQLITPRTRVILPVHYTGKICPIEPLLQVAHKHNLDVIEDASQAFGARHCDCPAGSFGRIACFSMNPMKIFAACGEAGVIVTDEPEIYDRLLALRYNGTVNKETCLEPSLNARLDTIQAAVLLRRLRYVEQIVNKRRQIASWYNDLLAGLVRTPVERDNDYDVYYTYTIQADRRDELKQFLESRGVETKIQHPILMPDQPAYRHKTRGVFPNAQKLIKRILSIPAHEKLTRTDVEHVADCFRRFYQ